MLSPIPEKKILFRQTKGVTPSLIKKERTPATAIKGVTSDSTTKGTHSSFKKGRRILLQEINVLLRLLQRKEVTPAPAIQYSSVKQKALL